MPKQAKSIGLPVRSSHTPQINRPADQYVPSTVSLKLDKITFIEYIEVPACIFMMDERFLKTSGARKLIKKIRGGNFIESAAALVAIIVIWQILGVGIEGFVRNNPNPGWGVDIPNPFQPQGGHLRYRPVYDEEFNDSFFELRQRLIYECDGFLKPLSSKKLEDFQIDPRSDGFGSLISFLGAECDNFTEDYQNEEFYDSIKDYFLKLQKALNEE